MDGGVNMQSLCRVLKRSASSLDIQKYEEEKEERKVLRTSLQTIESERQRIESEKQRIESDRLFQEFRLKDVQNDVRTRDALLKEKEKQVDSLLPLHAENVALRERLKEMEEKLVRTLREKEVLESRLMTQAAVLGDACQKKMATARENSTNSINGHLQVLRMIFVKNKIPEDDLAQYVLCEDGIRTAVALNLL